MNKNRYKLIFSQSKSCLVPVAECIKSAVGNGSSDSVSTSEGETDEPPLVAPHALSPVSLWVKNTFNPVSSVMQLTWKHVSVLLLTVVSVPAFALEEIKKPVLTDISSQGNDYIKLTSEANEINKNGKTKLHQTENSVIVIDIAKPNENKISHNNFEKFSIPNGAVFKNNKQQERSQIIGYLEKNPNLGENDVVDVILNQVKGSDESKIKGALEVLGKKADIVIANQNGITLNGVRTINSDRFVATTSSTIDPTNMELNVTQGKVTIDVNGFATDGLKYLDIIAKTIEQKQSIVPAKELKPETEITLIAGKSKYDLKEHKLTERNGETVAEGTVAITGASTGAMHGKNIKLIVTDKGAGVKHDGIILSEEDIHIELHDGDLDIGNTTDKTPVNTLDRRLQANKKIEVKKAKRATIGSELKADEIKVETQDLIVKANTEVRAKTADIKSKDTVSFEDYAKLVATKVDVKTEALTNKGVIYGSEVKLDANDLVNEKEIFAETKLDIETKGKEFSINETNYRTVRLSKNTASLKPGFLNKGVIESKGDATLTFKDKTSFLAQDNRFIKAGKNLTITAQNVEIEKQDIQLSSNLTINVKESFINSEGTLASAQNLTINAENGGIYNVGATLGAAKALNLIAKSNHHKKGNIVNREGSLLHTLGTLTLDTNRAVYNIGSIYAKEKIAVTAHELINDVSLSGDITYKTLGSSRLYEMSEVAAHGWHNNVYKLNLDIKELDKADIKVKNRGAIRSDGNFELKGITFTNAETSDDLYSKLINHGLINVKGTFKAEVDQITNQMKYYERDALSSVLRNEAKIKVHYQPLARFIWTALSGNTVREFNNLESFLDAVFSPSPLATTSLYSAENFSAYKILRHVQHSDMYQKAMAQVFGAEWHKLSYDQMKKSWKEFKDNPTSLKYYPAEKAKILAGTLDSRVKNLQNGQYAEYGKFDGAIKIGTHELTLPKIEFKPEIANGQDLDAQGIDFTTIAELLETPNLFIDYSVQFEKQYLDDEDYIIPPMLQNSDSLSSLNNDEYKTRSRTTLDPDYDNPDEFFENGHFFNELLKELSKTNPEAAKYIESYPDGDYFNYEKNYKRFKNLGEGNINTDIRNLFEKKREEHYAMRKESSKQALIVTEKKEEKRIVESKKEEKRQALDKVEKIRQINEEKRKVEEIHQKEKQLEIAIKQQEVKEQQEKAVAEAKQKAEQQRKIEQKAAQEKREVQQAQAYQESVKQETVVSKDTFLKVIDDNRPKVETDPLYRTKLKYINQDEYAGANYFFNQLGLDTQGNQKINVLGDNYFDHQLITRTIEKKADNRLNQKYNLTDVELVKKLMENSTSQAKALDLKIGAGLTKEQQSKLTEDIVWYVKTRVNGKDVFVPQVYLAPETVAENKKLQGLGTGVISAREVDIKADNVTNTGTLAGNKVKVEATNKIQNKGSILSTEETRLVGHKGIENLSRSFANNELGVETQRSEIRTEGHLHLETDKNASVDIQASDVKAKSAFVKTGDLNVKNTYNTKHSYQESIQGPSVNIGLDLRTFTPIFDVTAGSRSEQKSEATSVGSKIAVDQLHLAVEKDVNQVGSDIEAKRISGVVKGNYNTEAGKNIKHEEHEEYGSQTYLSAHASGGGTSVRYDYNSKEGGKASHNVPTSQTGLGADAGVSFTYEQEKETLLTHTNSELQVESGKLHVLGQADIGGVDINTRVPEKPQNKAALPESAAQTAEANPAEKPAEAAANQTAASQPNGAPVFNTLSDAEIADLMSEKTKEDFEQEAKKAPTSEGFELSAKEIKSTKQKDQYDQESVRTSFKIGPEAEAHSAIADMVSHLVKEYRDAQNGVKRDGTSALQTASDVLNIVTGDLAGTSAKLAVERNHETKRTAEGGDVLTRIGGNVTLSAHGGSVELRNVQSDENTNLTLKAKDDVNILAGEKNREVDETVSRQKLAAGVNAGCSMMSGACTAGGSVSLEGNESYTSERQTTHNNSLLQGQNIKIEAGRDLNLVSSNIDANNVDLNVQGKTNIVSKQDTLQKTTHGFDYNLSLGVALSSATIATPTGNIGAGYTNETETSRTVNQQAGIKANKLTGQVKDVNLKGGYLVSQDGSNSLKVTGDVTSKALQDQHDKDGGSFGLSVGISERGTTAFNIRGGRSDQKHYNATQQSTISGVDTSKAQVSGPVNTDLAKAKEVTRDDTYASTQFSFEVADIVELGQRAKNKLQSKLGGVPDNTPDVPTNKVRATEDAEAPQTRSRLADEVEAAAQKARTPETDIEVSTPKTRTFDTESESASVKNPIYESAESVATPRRSAGETEVSEVSPKVRLADNDADSVSVKNPVYESIETVGATPRARNTDSTETVENPLYTPLTPRVKASDDDGATAKTRVYEEIPLTDDGVASQALNSPRSKVATEEHTYEEVAQGPYSTVGDKNANGGRGLKVNNADEGTYNTVGDGVADTSRAKVKTNEEHTYEEVAQGPYSTVGDKNANGGRGLKAAGSSDDIYNKVGDLVADTTRTRSSSGEARVYEEVGAGPYSTLGDVNANGGRGQKVNSTVEGTYNTVGDGVADTTRTRSLSGEARIYEEVGAGPYSTLGDVNANGGRGPKVNNSAEGIYSTIEEVNVGTARRGSSAPEYSELQTPSRRQATDPLPDVPNSSRPRLASEVSDGIYSEIALKPRNAHDPLPDLPPEARRHSSEAPDFAEHVYESLPLAKRPLPNTPDAETKVTVSGSESEYASVNVTPRTRNPQDTLPETPNARPRSIADSDGIYSDADSVVVAQPKSNNRKVVSDYEQIPLDAIEGATAPSSSVKRASSEETSSLEPKVRHVAEESAEAGVNGKAKGNTTDELYATLDKTTEGRARANAKADEAVAQNAVNKLRVEEEAAPALPKRPDNLTSDVENFVPASTAKVVRPDNEFTETPSVRSRADDPDYTTVADVIPMPRAKGDRPLPETPDAQAPTQARDRLNVNGDYAEVLDTVAKPKANAGRELPDIPNQALPKVQLSSAEGDYAEIGHVPAAKPRAQNEQTVAEPQSVVATANTNNNSNRAKPVDVKDSATEVPAAAAKAEKSEKSWLTKVKDFFTGSSSKEQAKAKASKAAKAAEQDAQVAAKPRYDDLEDNINLKNLLALEEQRNESFESNVLKNAKFLDEAREAAKKTIPEATIKQMGNSPEFDEILTDGARKVEKRINDAVTFKPSAEEFADIQGLVKKLPKGEVIEDVTLKTQSITEALAETSKTIQRNPKLKEEVQAAIETFLKSSQGQDLTVEMVEKLNHGLRPDEGDDRQLYKKETLTKENAVFSSPEAAKIQLSETVDFINQAKRQGVEPSVLAGLVYQRLIAYHPFAEGNGRMARVIVNKLLLDAGYPPFTKFNSDFETQIIPQTLKSAKSATSTEVVKEFLTELSHKPLPEVNSAATKAKVSGEEPIYAKIDKSPEALAIAKARGDEAAANTVKVKTDLESDVPPALPPRSSEATSSAEGTVTLKAATKEKPPVAPKPKVKVVVESDADGVARTRVVVQPEVAEAPQVRARPVGNSDYAEVVDGVPQVQPRSKAPQTVESDYADIVDGVVQTQPIVKARLAEETAAPNKLKVDDGLYATVDKSPEALARAKARGDEAAAAQASTRKVQVEEDAPALPKRAADLSADDAASEAGATEPKFRSLPIDLDESDAATAPAQTKATPVSDRIQQKELIEQSRGVLKQVQDQFQPLKVKNKIDAVRSSVEEYGGEVSFKFAQSKGEVYKEIVKHLETQNGVCESTCAHWIAKKVDPQDDNFWNSLYEGGKKGHLKQETIDSIKKLQTEFINSGSATQQFKLTDSWLQEQGVVPKEKTFGSLSRRDEVAGTVSKTDVSALSKAILDTGNETSGVKKISINLEGGSHTVSAAIQGQKVVFFDPNFGEMTFPSHQKFEAWLKEAFWNKSGYAGKNEGKRFFNVVNYELPAKAAENNHVGQVKPTTASPSDVNFKTRAPSNTEGSATESSIQIKRDAARGESYVTKDDVVTAITNTNYIPKPVTEAEALFEKARQKAKSADSAKEAEKKLALIAKESKNLPKEHLLKATNELVNGMSTEEIRALRQEHKKGAVLPSKDVIQGFDGENVKSMGKILKNIQFEDGYVETRKQINEKIVEKLDSNKEFHDLMNKKLSGNEEGIRKLFDIVETAKRESLKEVTGIEGTKATLELNTKNGPLSMGQGYYANDEVHMNAKPIASFLRSKQRNNQEILDTIVHELTHHDQAQITKHRYDNSLPETLKTDANVLALNENYYIDADLSNFSAYKKQPLEREAFSSGHNLSEELSKLVDRGYRGKVQEIETIEHLPNKLNNLESPRAAHAELGENALIYGLKQGRKELIARANAADTEGNNAILADSYVGKLNLGFEFAQLSSFAKQVKAGNVSEQDIQEIASFTDSMAKMARRDDSRNRINEANVEDNQRIIRELIKNENAVDALKRIATLSDQEQDMYDALRKNPKFDMEELQESANYTTEENKAIRDYQTTQTALNDARMDFFAEKTKFIAKETLERGGQLYFALDGLATDTPTYRENSKIDLARLKEVFDPANPFYDSVTSRELRYLYENYKDHPNLKFTIKDHVIENPLKTLEIPTTESAVSSGEQSTAYKKQLLPNLFKRKAKSEGPKIEHLGGTTDKDAFYFPLDKIVTKNNGISKDMKVNLDNIKKAFNPKDSHYESSEARNLRALYEQDPTMSSTRFVIGNQVIENPFKSPELQDYIKKHHVNEPVAKKAKPLPAVPTKAMAGKEDALQKPSHTHPRKPVQPPKPKAEQAADPSAIYAQVNKNRKAAQVDGFYPESQLRTRSDRIVEQVSHAPTTEPTYADLQFPRNATRSQAHGSDAVIYDEVASPAQRNGAKKPEKPKTAQKPQKPQALSHGIIPESQLKTRSDRLVEQVSHVPTTEPTYAELQFQNQGKHAARRDSNEVVYETLTPKAPSKPAPKKPEKPQKVQKPGADQPLSKGIIPESQLKTRSDRIVEQVSHAPTTEPVYADVQFRPTGKNQNVISSHEETIYEKVGTKTQEEPIYQNVIRKNAK